MRWVILLLAVLAGCGVANDGLDNETIPTTETNIPGERGELSVRTQDVQYYESTTGYEARPDTNASYPGVVMIHEWWGLNGHIRTTAEELASHGYHVLAVDLYEGEVAQDASQARNLVGALDQEEALMNLQAATNYLRSEGDGQVASLGWCFGGGQSFQLAKNEDLDAAIIYYGTVSDDVEGITEPVLGVFGENDTSIPVSTVASFENALDEAEVDNEFHVYENAGHAFANPSGGRYMPQAAQDAWKETLDFLERNLG